MNSGFWPKMAVVFRQSEVPYLHQDGQLEALLKEEMAILKKCLKVRAHLPHSYCGINSPYQNKRIEI